MALRRTLRDTLGLEGPECVGGTTNKPRRSGRDRRNLNVNVHHILSHSVARSSGSRAVGSAGRCLTAIECSETKKSDIACARHHWHAHAGKAVLNDKLR